MAANEELMVDTSAFTAVVEARIEANEGLFELQQPFLSTACRGLAARLNPELYPQGFTMATELYIADVARGIDGFTGEPMPSDVSEMPPLGAAIIRTAALDIAQEAFGDEYAEAIQAEYRAVAAAAEKSQE